jgi:hypothetical protein
MSQLLTVPVLLLSAFPAEHAVGVPVTTVANVEFHSAFWVNLHHTLYAAAWSKRPDTGGRRLVPPLPSPLDAPLGRGERAAWDSAVAYYDRELANRDLRTGRGMTEIKRALAADDMGADAVGPALRAVLEQAAPVYRKHYWTPHDRSNRDWIDSTATLFRSIEREIVTSHERLYGRPWFSAPVRVDVVWAGRAYTTLNPLTHTTVSPAERSISGWTGLEIVLHELGHELIVPTDRVLSDALGARRENHRDLWHTIQFYLTGAALQRVLAARGIEYAPYMYSTGLFDRAWRRYRPTVEEHWGAFVRGEITQREAIERTVAALR